MNEILQMPASACDRFGYSRPNQSALIAAEDSTDELPFDLFQDRWNDDSVRVLGQFFQIVYTSTASVSFSRVELMALLKGSFERNTRAGITGLLLYQDGSFMQVLEGEEPVVKALFAKICRDPRHHSIIPLIREQIEERNFPGSAMAFRDLDASELREQPGYSDFLNKPMNGNLLAMDLPKCYRLLLHFKRNLR